MFESRRRSGGSANRWLIVAGAGLVILAFVARMLLDIGNTKVSDLAAAIRPPDTATATVPAPVPDSAPPPDPAPAAATITPPVVTVPVTPPETSAVAPAPAPDRQVTVTKPPPVLRMDTTSRAAGAYAVQIGAFGSEPNAAKLSQRASALGYSAVVVAQPRSGSTLYLVQVKGLSGADEARQVSDSLARKLGVKSVVVPPARQDR